ncbi:MAG: sigma-70 family RNA polymerase sigma factor [Saprospiraceae bacterium]|nr:sigma-70 family RNA polymerase sigma factor [Saprospiraceae bacterium]
MNAYYDLYEDVLSYVMARGVERAEAEDVVQDAYLKLLRHQQQGKKITNPAGWLKKVSYHLMVDHYRKTKPAHIEDASQIEAETDSEDHGPEDCLLGIIASLPYKYKKAVYLVDVKGIKQRVAAESLGLSLPTF